MDGPRLNSEFHEKKLPTRSPVVFNQKLHFSEAEAVANR